MVEGLLIVNGYMRTTKFDEITALYMEAANKLGIHLRCCYTNEIIYGYEEELIINNIKSMQAIKFVLFLDKDVSLAKQFEKRGIRVFNTSKVIATCDHKGKTFEALQGHGIPMPKTIVAPLVFEGTYNREKDTYFLRKVTEALGFPMVVKECYGSFGEQVYKVDNQEQLITLRQKLVYIPHLYQEYIESSCGRDVRVQVVGGKVVASMLRTSEVDFRANISNGGRMQPYTLSRAFQDLAKKVSDCLGVDFAGIDLMFGKNEEPIVCEVNSNAHIKNIYECTGTNVAMKILEYIEEEIKKC